jgi:hypothetical protein
MTIAKDGILFENETNSRGGKIEIALNMDKLFILGIVRSAVVEKMDRVCKDP